MIEKGEIVQCPSCGDAIAEIIKNLDSGQPLSEDCFLGLQERIITGMVTACKECGVAWFTDGNIFIRNRGWTC